MAAFALRNPLRNVSAEMNITPLVDVMLVLLVIFILATPLPTQKLALVNAPACAAQCAQPAEPIRLAIKRTGELYWNGTAISRAALALNLAGVARDPSAPPVEVHTEAQARYALVTDVLAAARNAGVERVGIAPAEH
jgi:biopolymer transport protein ExbD